MPGKLSFVSDKIRSISDTQLDAKNTKGNSNYEPVDAVEDMSEADCKSNWFKTWPERHYDKLEPPNEQSPEEDPANPKAEKSPVPLNKILDKIPLAYSPLTKQLHLLKPNEESEANASGRNPGESDDEFDQFRSSGETTEDGKF